MTLWKLMRPTVLAFGMVSAVGAVAPAEAGPWSALPEAVSTLQREPGNQAAQGVVRAAEESLLAEADRGHLAATASLMDAYETLVIPLSDGTERALEIRARASASLVRYGDRVVETDSMGAGAAWSLAAAFDASPSVLVRLQDLVLPPADPEPGATWVSEIDGADLVFVPGGQFELGCIPGDPHCRADEDGVSVSVDDLWIETREVTNERYRRCVLAGACTEPIESESLNDPDRSQEPVVGVTWRQARDYARWTGRRLPSEAEWQRAAMDDALGGRFPWGKGRARAAANVYETSETDPFDGVAPVASFPATGWGLHDMGGNVWEWCADRYHRDLTGAPGDGRPWVRGGWGRVQRGGSWRRTVDLARFASRTWQEEDYFADDVGFRCVADVPERVSPQQLMELASQSFPLPARPGSELSQAQLSRADREFLEVRAVTWLVLEGRLAEALPRVVSLLRRDSRHPVALELLEQLEREMETGIERGDLVSVREGVSGYRSAVAGDRQLTNRLIRHESKLKRQSVTTGRQFASRGEYDLAKKSLEFASSLRPHDEPLAELPDNVTPRPGTRRVSAKDGKLMVWVPGGEYRMGASVEDGAAKYDEHPARSVSVTGFWMDAHEITNGEYRRCVNAGACSPPIRQDEFVDPELDDHPVVWVTWFQAANYARWAGKRLATEAEWERAARAGSVERYPWGHQFQPWKANGVGSEGGDPFPATAPAGSYPSNDWGLFDLIGNAAEWTADRYHRNYWGAPSDDRAWNQLTGEWVEPKRVVRGGSFTGSANALRVSNRGQRPPETSARNVGFRCVAD